MAQSALEKHYLELNCRIAHNIPNFFLYRWIWEVLQVLLTDYTSTPQMNFIPWFRTSVLLHKPSRFSSKTPFKIGLGKKNWTILTAYPSIPQQVPPRRQSSAGLQVLPHNALLFPQHSRSSLNEHSWTLPCSWLISSNNLNQCLQLQVRNLPGQQTGGLDSTSKGWGREKGEKEAHRCPQSSHWKKKMSCCGPGEVPWRTARAKCWLARHPRPFSFCKPPLLRCFSDRSCTYRQCSLF